ncbi:hypothetical protein AACH06_22700 [Ideonella sp. DXS29W]|uniref:NADH:ubiquinone oxidoreductase intermediate-associated protein 30 domain-containing protein n=1 Tax=Ideonella lacteola TaxID=2984193 RepID=A0ABU9BUI5_9BURK
MNRLKSTRRAPGRPTGVPRALGALSTLLAPWAIAHGATLSAMADQYLDFNDNLVPPGWKLRRQSDSGPCGVGHHRFFAGQTNGACTLSSSLEVAPGTGTLTVAWKGNLQHDGHAHHQEVTLSTPTGSGIVVRVAPSSTPGSQAGFLTVISDNMGEVLQFSTWPDGTYHFHLRVTQNQLRFTGRVDGRRAIDYSRQLISVKPDQIKRVQLGVEQSIGEDQWMDNVSIKQRP